MSTTPRFAVNQHVVYPLHGIGKIIHFEELDFKGKKVNYYVIYLDMVEMTIKIPFDKSDELGIREIIPKEKAEAALESIKEEPVPQVADWKLRHILNKELLKEGTIENVATVVKSLYKRSQVKELPVQERKLYDDAVRFLIHELSLALNKTRDEIESTIHSFLELEI